MTNRGEYFIYILEQYKRRKAIGGKAALSVFTKHGIISYIWASYEALHTMADDAVIQDIDDIVSAGQKATPELSL
jgi:hypothetical protein